jgi:hypothetical protein
MGGFIELPDGPSGRTPIVAVSLAEKNGISHESHLVLFQDGTMGYRMGDTPGLPWFRQQPKSFDGSEYSMLFHNSNQLGKIEKTIFSQRKMVYFRRFTFIVGLAIFGLFLYHRLFSQWPPTLDDAVGGFLLELLFLILMFSISCPSLFWDISGGEITVRVIDTEPHIFPIHSEITKSIALLHGVQLCLLLSAALQVNCSVI